MVKVRTAVEPMMKLAKLSFDLRLFSRKLNLLNCTHSTCLFNTLFHPSFLLTILFDTVTHKLSWSSSPTVPHHVISLFVQLTLNVATVVIEQVGRITQKLYLCIDVWIERLQADTLADRNVDVRGHFCKPQSSFKGTR